MKHLLLFYCFFGAISPALEADASPASAMTKSGPALSVGRKDASGLSKKILHILNDHRERAAQLERDVDELRKVESYFFHTHHVRARAHQVVALSHILSKAALTNISPNEMITRLADSTKSENPLINHEIKMVVEDNKVFSKKINELKTSLQKGIKQLKELSLHREKLKEWYQHITFTNTDSAHALSECLHSNKIPNKLRTIKEVTAVHISTEHKQHKLSAAIQENDNQWDHLIHQCMAPAHDNMVTMNALFILRNDVDVLLILSDLQTNKISEEAASKHLQEIIKKTRNAHESIKENLGEFNYNGIKKAETETSAFLNHLAEHDHLLHKACNQKFPILSGLNAAGNNRTLSFEKLQRHCKCLVNAFEAKHGDAEH